MSNCEDTGLVDNLLKSLSPKEWTVLHWLIQGYKSKDIAQQLCRSPRTIRIHRASILKKCGVENDTQLLNWLYQHGYLPTIQPSLELP